MDERIAALACQPAARSANDMRKEDPLSLSSSHGGERQRIEGWRRHGVGRRMKTCKVSGGNRMPSSTCRKCKIPERPSQKGSPAECA
eukprot:763996-Hanusia_phi.AAC.8